jgi:hypothetical protein
MSKYRCGVCEAPMTDPGYGGPETCPGCGLVWDYDEGHRVTEDSIRQLLAEARRRRSQVDALEAEVERLRDVENRWIRAIGSDLEQAERLAAGE